MSNRERSHAPANKAMAEKIKQLRTSLGLRQVEFAERVDVDQSIVSKWERGLQEPNAERTVRLAELAGQTVGEWLGLRPMTSRDAHTRTYKIVGELRAGDWKEAIEFAPDEQHDVAIPMAPGMPDIPLQGYIVRGNSMNQIYPDGTLVFVAATIANRIQPRSGQKVLVQRRNADGLYEATLKELVIEQDGTPWLWPRSTAPEHQAPIAWRSTDTEEVTVTGVVMASFIMEALR